MSLQCTQLLMETQALLSALSQPHIPLDEQQMLLKLTRASLFRLKMALRQTEIALEKKEAQLMRLLKDEGE